MEILFYPDTGCFLARQSDGIDLFWRKHTDGESAQVSKKHGSVVPQIYQSAQAGCFLSRDWFRTAWNRKRASDFLYRLSHKCLRGSAGGTDRTHCGTNIMRGLPILNRSCSEKQAFLWSPHLIGYQLLSLEHGCRRAKADQDFDGGIPCGSIFPDPDWRNRPAASQQRTETTDKTAVRFGTEEESANYFYNPLAWNWEADRICWYTVSVPHKRKNAGIRPDNTGYHFWYEPGKYAAAHCLCWGRPRGSHCLTAFRRITNIQICQYSKHRFGSKRIYISSGDDDWGEFSWASADRFRWRCLSDRWGQEKAAAQAAVRNRDEPWR